MWVGTFLRQWPQLCQACWPPSVLFSQRGPSEGSWRGQWARQAYFGTSCLARVLRRGPEDLLVALRGLAGVWARVSASGQDWPWPLQAPFRVSLSSFCLHGNPSLTQVLCMFCCSCGCGSGWAASCLVIRKPGVGAVGGSWIGCSVTSTLGRQDWEDQHNLQRALDPLGAQGAVGPPVLPAVSWGWPSQTIGVWSCCSP